MLTIWGRRNSVNVQKVMWCVEELGIEHRRMDAGREFGRNDESWFLEQNPNGRIPLLDDDDFYLWESNAIVRYLCARYAPGSLYPEQLERRARAEMWMDWQLSTLAPPLRVVFWNLIRLPEAERDERAVVSNTPRVLAALDILDGQLGRHEFLAGRAFTMADIPAGALVHRWLALPRPADPGLENLRAWQERLAARPAFRHHVMLPLS